jgi:hypothetical protein
MTHKLSWVPALRVEPEFLGRWGLRSYEGRWMTVVYANEAEAKIAAAAMTSSPGRMRSQNDNVAASLSRVS